MDEHTEPGRDGHGQIVASPAAGHMPVRPTWQCTCGREWPCVDAMVAMEADFAGATPSFGMYLTMCWTTAVHDLPDEDVAVLYRRMVGWRHR